MSGNSEIFRISLNYKGSDVTVDTDFDTACLLLNDVQAAEQFLKKYYEDELPSTSATILKTPTKEVLSDRVSDKLTKATQQPKLNKSTEEAQIIWTKKKPTEDDQNATYLLLELRKKFSTEFDDKKTNKGKIWNKIGRLLEENSFKLGEGGGERCRQKFANICKPYFKFIKNQQTTGSEKIEVPPYFEEIHSILGGKDKVQPRCLNDSIEIVEEEDGGTTEETEMTAPTEMTSPTAKNSLSEKRFEARKRLRPLTKTENILQEIQKDRRSRTKEFSVLENHLKKTEEQRERLLAILEKSLGKNKMHPSREIESSDSSD